MNVVVTGAAGAIGAAVVRAYAADGTATIVAQDVRAVPAELTSLPGVEELTGDLRGDECRSALRRACADGGATAVVAAHGVFNGSDTLADLDLDAARRLMEINFATVVGLFEALSEELQAARGRYVVIASQAALRGEPGNGIYAASKWAARAWALATDRNVRRTGVRVHVACPGRTESPLLETALNTFAVQRGLTRDEYARECEAIIPAGRFGQPEEIANVIRYLTSAGGNRPTEVAINGGEVPW